MSTENTPTTVNEKIITYFDNDIGFKDFAKQIRRATYILSDVMMQPEVVEQTSNSHWARDCFFYLNMFAELIDPILENE